MKLLVFLLLLCLAPLAWANGDEIRPTITETSRIVMIEAVNQVPEPSTLLLLAGVAGVAWLVRRK